MSEQSLAEYVENLLRQGYSERQIRQYLAQNKYPQSLIDAVFFSLGGNAGDAYPGSATDAAGGTGGGARGAATSGTGGVSSAQNSVAILAAYLTTYLNQGYQVEQLRPFLLQQGHAPGDVDAAIAQATGQPVIRHEVHVPGATILKLALLFLLLGGVVYGVMLLKGGGGVTEHRPGEHRLLDVTMTLERSSLLVGETARVEVTATNLGDKGTYDVELTYALLDVYGAPAWSEIKTKAVSTSFTDTARIPLRGLRPGSYDVKVTARYGGEAPATASKRLTVGEKREEPEDEEPEDGDDDGSSVEPPVRPPVDIIILPPDEQESATEQALAAAKRGDAAAAEGFCRGISNQARRDACLGLIILTTRQASQCDAITGLEERETCLMPFIIEGEYALCAKLVSKERKDLCANLERLSKLALPRYESPPIDDFVTPEP